MAGQSPVACHRKSVPLAAVAYRAACGSVGAAYGRKPVRCAVCSGTLRHRFRCVASGVRRRTHPYLPVIGQHRARPPLTEEAVNAHDSLLSLYTPCCGCTCAISRHAPVIGVRIVAQGFDTTLLLDASVRRRTGDRENPWAAEETRSAVVMTMFGKNIRSYSIVPSDHPVR